MAYNTFDDLSTALQEYMEDDDAEFQGSIDDVINNGENRVVKDLDLALFRRTDSTTTMTIGQPTFARPNVAPETIIALKAASVSGGGLTRGNVFLERRSKEFVAFYNQGVANGVPKYYADHDESTICVGPPPDAAYTFVVRYLSKPTPLASGNQTNWLTDTVPELLFQACLAESERFLKGDERIPVWKAEYAELLVTTKRDLYAQQQNQYDRLGAVPVPQTNRSNM